MCQYALYIGLYVAVASSIIIQPTPLSLTIIFVFNVFLLAAETTVIGRKICVQTSRFANIWPRIEQTRVIFTHLNRDPQLQVGKN